MSSRKNKITESKLIKAIAELEGVAKGDPLEEADPEGGLSTEGKPLSDAAPSGRGESTKKSRVSKASSSASSDDDDDDDDDSSSDDDSDDAARMAPPKRPEPPFKKKKSRVSKASSSSSSASSDDDEDDDDDTKKSFRQRAENDETMRKAIVVNDFIEAMVDQISLALHDVQKSIAKSFAGLEERLSARIDEQVSKSSTSQQAFNARLAKAVAAIGNIVQDDLLGMADVVKSLADQPTAAPRGKAVLTKGEVNQPPWGGAQTPGADQRLVNGSGDYVQELGELSPEAIGDWLFKKSANNQVDSRIIMAWEADRYNIETLPLQIRKAIVNDLVK